MTKQEEEIAMNRYKDLSADELMTHYRVENIHPRDEFRFGSTEERDRHLRDLEEHNIKCLAYNRDSEFYFRVIGTPTEPPRPEDLREWYDEGSDEPIDQEKVLYDY